MPSKVTIKRKDFIEGIHYYLENGLVVFTEEYHKNRAVCCGSGCRHCPYFPKYQKGNKILDPSRSTQEENYKANK